MSKSPKSSRVQRQVSTGRFTHSKTFKNSENGKTVAGSVLNTHSASRDSKSGRFMDGVRKISERDRVGLIKLADR